MVTNDPVDKNNISQERLLQMLDTAFGPVITDLLYDPHVIEIMLNPDGKLFIERLGEGCTELNEKISAAAAEQVILLVANGTKTEFDKKHPLLSAELPGSGHRFEGILPPVSENPMFSIRKKAISVFTLDNYVKQDIMTEHQRQVIVESIRARKNILVSGGTGSGKTTLLNAILDEISQCSKDRIVIIEDTQELQCTANNKVFLRSQPHVSMNDLLRSTMRLRPDRICVGEVRGPEALTLIKAWNTGHPGGCASIHANNCISALTRVESLIQEAIETPPKGMIAETINLIVQIEKFQEGRRIKEMIAVQGFKDQQYIFKII